MPNGSNRQSGFTYLTILFVIAVAGVLLAQIGINWTQTSQREKESELLFVGNQYRQAIMLYYERTPGPIKRYPTSLEDLVTDNRYNPPQHYLRKLYRDPVTNSTAWGLIAAPSGGIMGVYSLSEKAPLKIAGFTVVDADFEGKVQYSDWKFEYLSPFAVSK